MTENARHRFATGSGTAIVGPAGAALVAAGSGDPIVAKLHNHLLAGETFAHLVESLLQAGLEGLAPFAVVSADDGGHRVLIRGDVHADVRAGERVDHLSGANLTVWREESYTEVGTVVFSLADAGELEFEVNAGVVPASALSYTPTGRTSAAPAAPAAQTPAGAATPAPTPAPAQPAVEVMEPFEKPEAEPTEVETEADVVDEPDEPEAEVVQEPEPVVAIAPEMDDDDNEHTVIRQPTPAGAPDPDPEPRPQAVLTPSTPTAPTAPEPVEPASGIISGRPQHFAAVETATPAPIDADHDGRTEIRRPAAPATPKPILAAPLPATHSGPTVHAITCPQGHPNPVTQGRCRQCDAEIIERASVTIPRPPLGVLRFSNNEVVDLDGPIAIGRMPPGDPIDGAAPHVMAIDNSELSRFHALITVDEWFVYVTDQGSTNETSVIAPGRAPITCRAHERVLVPPGAVVNLGGAVTCRFDVI